MIDTPNQTEEVDELADWQNAQMVWIDKLRNAANAAYEAYSRSRADAQLARQNARTEVHAQYTEAVAEAARQYEVGLANVEADYAEATVEYQRFWKETQAELDNGWATYHAQLAERVKAGTI